MTLQTAAQMALDSQDAVNLSGVLASIKEIVHEVIWPEARRLGKGTAWVNSHPIVTVFLSKLCSLNKGYFECNFPAASDACKALARGEAVEYQHAANNAMMDAWTSRFRTPAFRAGFVAGLADKRLGVTSRYASTSFPSESEYQQDYSRGYQMGQQEAKS